MTSLALDATIPLARGRDHAGELLSPSGLARWMCSRAHLAAPDGLELVVEEEYGYRRFLAGHAEWTDGPEAKLTLRVERAERAWDGDPAAVAGPHAGPARWRQHAAEGTTLELAVADDVLDVAWTGFADGADDIVRREGAALVHALELAGAVGGDGERAATRVAVTRTVDAGTNAAWDALVAGAWPTPGVPLRAEPGRSWRDAGGSGSGRVLVAVRGRRLVASWRAGADARPAGLLDLRLEAVPGRGSRQSRLTATLVVAGAGEREARFAEAARAQLDASSEALVGTLAETAAAE